MSEHNGARAFLDSCSFDHLNRVDYKLFWKIKMKAYFLAVGSDGSPKPKDGISNAGNADSGLFYVLKAQMIRNASMYFDNVT